MGKFELYTRKDGQTAFRLKASNGQNILASEAYKAKKSAENGIASVQKNATDESKFHKLTSTSGKAYFVIKAGNGEVIGTSQMYKSTSGRNNGIKSVMKNAPKAKIEDLT